MNIFKATNIERRDLGMLLEASAPDALSGPPALGELRPGDDGSGSSREGGDVWGQH